MQCPQCQFENVDGMNFCGKCGTKLERFCPQCNFGNPGGYEFCGKCGNKLSIPSEPHPGGELSFDEKIAKIQKYLPKGLTEKILSQRDRIEGERKQVTVMFCDMEDFTQLAEKLGPDDTYVIMDQVYETLIHKVHDYEGTVNEMTGDGIMALFGAPIALEDAPQRAIRSALAIHREIAKFNDKIRQEKTQIVPLRMRIGIHTGPVVVGTLGNDLRVEFKAVGDTVNLASRVEGLAEPGVTYITEETYKLTEGLFRVEALGERKIKGKESPVKIYRVIASSTRRTRFDVSAEGGLTPFVGRDREIELLLDGFERVKQGNGQAYSIVSEAGVGKSRLLYEFRKKISNEDVTLLEGKCFSYSRSVAYHLHTDILRANFNIKEGSEDLEIRENIKRGLKLLGEEEKSALPYLLELLETRDSGIDKVPISHEAKKDRIKEMLKRIILKGSEIRPLILSYEDLHWVDKSSEDALKYILESIPGSRVLMIFTYRPEFVPTWGGKTYHNQLNLNRLSNRESLSMINHLIGNHDIENSLAELILEKTEGVPFYIEEFVKSFRDLKVIEKKGNTYRIVKDVQIVNIPAGIQDVIMARVDSLTEEAKGLIQASAVVGREFSYQLIKSMTDLAEQQLLSHLSALKDLELIYERGIYPESDYVFKHALTQEAVYESLMKRTRQKYHQRIAQVLSEHFPTMAETQPALLAHHFTEAGLVEPAIYYLQKAGEKAIKRSAHTEAIANFTKELELLRILPDTTERSRQELMIRNALTPALIVTKGYSAPDIQFNYERAGNLCQRIGDSQQLFSVTMGSYVYNLVRGDNQKAHELGEQLLKLAHLLQDKPFFVGAHRSLGSTFFWLGDFGPAMEHLKQATSNYDPRQDDHFVTYLLGAHIKVHCFLYPALILQLIGYPDQAAKMSHEALLFSQETGHPYTLSAALFFTAWFHYSRREVCETQMRAEVAVNLSSEHGFPFWHSGGSVLLGWALAEQGKTEEGISMIRRGLASFRETGAQQWLPIGFSMLAEAYLKSGKIEDGLQHVEEALALISKTKERFWETEIYRLKGELLLALGLNNKAEAEENFHQAIDVARRQQAKSMELRAAVGLSRLWKNQGKNDAGRQLVTDIYSWFEEGFDTPDLKEAKALLELIS